MKRKITLSLILLFFLISMGTALASGKLESAKKFYDAGEYKESISLLKDITKQEPSNAAAWILMGNGFLRLGKAKKAINAFGKTLAIAPENEEAFFGLGLAYGRMRKHQNAIEAFKKAIEINPEYARAHFELGVVYDRISNISYAFEQYRILKTLDKTLADRLYHIILGN